ncbi:MAG TPA: M56 family metallopeptidase, partial [Bryobacteraceae bacterium]
LTLTLRKNRAAVRYWVWLAASVKFLIPFSLLIRIGSQFEWRSAPSIALTRFAIVMNEAHQPFVASTSISALSIGTRSSYYLQDILMAVWFCGAVLGLAYWVRLLLQLRAIRRRAIPLNFDLPIPVLSASGPLRMEPGVFGIFRPVIILPGGIIERLAPAQLDAVLAHELCHVRRRDNLTATIHMVVEVIFWFHPLVWWLCARLVEERERACDEEVTGDPQVFAEAILHVCRLYTATPVTCVSGVTGASLTRRVEAIMANRRGECLTRVRKFLLSGAGFAALAGPIAIGLTAGPGATSLALAQAQTESGAATFEAASVKPAALWKAGGEGSKRSKIEYASKSLSMWNVDLSDCVQWAWDVPFFRVSGPDFPDGERYDIVARTEGPVPVSQLRLMLRSLLNTRFHLALRQEKKMIPVYDLVVAKGGSKLPPRKAESELPADHAAESLPRVQDGGFVFHNASMAGFAAKLSMLRGIETPVIDQTHIDGVYDITLKSAANAILRPDGVSLFTLVQEQLGLRLVSAKAPMEMFVIERVSRPSEN